MESRLLLKKEILALKKKKLFVLSSFGHAGIDWVHSLLDGHEEILIAPAFSYYRTYYRFLYRSKINLFLIEDYDYLSKIISDLFYFHPGYKVKRRKFLFNLTEKKNFEKYLKIYLKTDTEILEKKIFYAIHFAFAKIKKKKIDKIKNIVIHEHVAWHCFRYLTIFKSKFIFIFRNPKASLGGAVLKMKKSNKSKILKSIQFDTIILHMKTALEFIIKYKNKKKFYILQNEKMHENLKSEMLNLANWMKIKFSKQLLSQTFLKKKWLGESSYLAKDELKKNPPKNFYQPIEVEKRWRSVLDKNDILMTEIIFQKQMKLMNHNIENKISFINIIRGYFIFLLRYIYQEKYFFSKTIIISRNIVRKLFILISTKITLMLFTFH
ncbi:hypothetical protein OAM62_00965 [Candidatus Pelagibacter sp.]|nr:hypothetical protein [Candidatus Pelagibacter sp.]MDC1248231.1 hypothetical protein [Pelagibacteraceae bacterium]